jgi:flagellar biogenesis protein FliO
VIASAPILRTQPFRRLARPISLFVAILALLICVDISHAQTTQPAAPPPPQQQGRFENVPLGGTPRSANSADSNTSADEKQSNGGNSADLLKVVLALAVVLSLIFALKWAGRRYFAGAAAVGTSRAVQVLHRTPISPKQQLMLVQVGRRVIVVANTGVQMNSLCEISDADEVAELIGQIRQEKGDSITKTFSSLFRKEEEVFDSEARKAVMAPLTEEKESNAVDPALVDTQAEISGLMDRVRTLSKQFRGTGTR